MSEVIGFCEYEEDGIRWHGCRGFGKSYKNFYVWLNNIPLAEQRDDWPWHYFVFQNKTDEEYFLEKNWIIT